jgi:hypothetical protein
LQIDFSLIQTDRSHEIVEVTKVLSKTVKLVEQFAPMIEEMIENKTYGN